MVYCDGMFPISEKFYDYLHDETKTVGNAESISFPTSAEEVSKQLQYFETLKKRVTVQGNRTGLTAASVPKGGHIMSLERMCGVVGMEIAGDDEVYIRVQPGLSLGALRSMLASRTFDVSEWDEKSLKAYEIFTKLPYRYFPPDPTEASASIGGMVSCNASGAKTYYYGSTRAYVNGVTVALTDGDFISLKRGERFAEGRSFSLKTEGGREISGKLPEYKMPSCKNAAGYYAEDNMDLVDLFIGSDGTLGVITEIELRLIPQPKEIWGINCFFEKKLTAIKFVEKIRKSAKLVVAIEYFDRNALEILRKYDNSGYPVPNGYDCLIYIEIHAHDEAAAMKEINLVGETMDVCGGSSGDTWAAKSAPDRNRLLELRHKVPESVNALIAERKRKIPNLAKVASDMAVPDGRLRDIIEIYDKDLADNGFEYAIWGHIGNNHLHVNILPKTEDDMKRGKEMFKNWAKMVVNMGGTVSAEHGIGKTKSAFLPVLYGEKGVRQMAELKRKFDPGFLLGTGNIFSEDIIK